jgi:DNA-binding NarL/FixJ family response regulator
MGSQFLIVDDSEVVRQGLRQVLQANPQWEICGEAADGQTAVELFRKLPPSLVVLDFKLPDIDGLEVARRMATISPSVPIVMFTQHASNVLEKLAKAVGIRAVVSKTDAFTMLGVIQSLLTPENPKTSSAVSGAADHSQPEEL